MDYIENVEIAFEILTEDYYKTMDELEIISPYLLENKKNCKKYLYRTLSSNTPIYLSFIKLTEHCNLSARNNCNIFDDQFYSFARILRNYFEHNGYDLIEGNPGMNFEIQFIRGIPYMKKLEHKLIINKNPIENYINNQLLNISNQLINANNDYRQKLLKRRNAYTLSRNFLNTQSENISIKQIIDEYYKGIKDLYIKIKNEMNLDVNIKVEKNMKIKQVEALIINWLYKINKDCFIKKDIFYLNKKIDILGVDIRQKVIYDIEYLDFIDNRLSINDIFAHIINMFDNKRLETIKKMVNSKVYLKNEKRIKNNVSRREYILERIVVLPNNLFSEGDYEILENNLKKYKIQILYYSL